MNSKEHFENIKKNLDIVREMGELLPDGDYLCPLCLSPFLEEQAGTLTEEDVPQASLGGTRITLTCRTCNSSCGSKIDVYLQETLKAREQKLFLPGTDRKITIITSDKSLNAKLGVAKNNKLKLIVSKKNNNPKVFDEYNTSILNPDSLIKVKDKPLKIDQSRFNAAILKNAYLLLFAKTGFSVLSHKYYNSLRMQILEPDIVHIPVCLWTFQSLNCSDGIYFSRNEDLNGFFIFYTLKLQEKYKVCVFIPIPDMDFEDVSNALHNIHKGTALQMECLCRENYLTDAESVKELRCWCNIR